MPSKPPTSVDERTARTLAHYDGNAERFWQGTRDHDVTQNYAALLDALARPAPLRLLDFGCGPGRDLLALSALGHVVTGLDGSAEFVAMARGRFSGEVWHQNFLALDLGQAHFDGIFANAWLFHVPGADLARVLGQLFQSLVPGGVLFCSNPRAFEGDREGFSGERYGTYLTRESWLERIASVGFSIERDFLRPSDKPPSEQPWLAVVARRPVS